MCGGLTNKYQTIWEWRWVYYLYNSMLEKNTFFLDGVRTTDVPVGLIGAPIEMEWPPLVSGKGPLYQALVLSQSFF
jgi:hypothetical protein